MELALDPKRGKNWHYALLALCPVMKVGVWVFQFRSEKVICQFYLFSRSINSANGSNSLVPSVWRPILSQTNSLMCSIVSRDEVEHANIHTPLHIMLNSIINGKSKLFQVHSNSFTLQLSYTFFKNCSEFCRKITSWWIKILYSHKEITI